jgi:outer membrane protein TolC
MNLFRHAAATTGASRALAAVGLALQLVCGAPARAEDAPLGATVQGLLEHARTRNPELDAMRREADAATERIGPAGAWSDPVLRVELMNVNNYGNDASPSLLPSRVGETKYTLMQSLPLWGKRELRRDAAAADATQAGARADATWAELAGRIKATYAEYYRAAGNERLVGEVLGLMTRLEQIAQVRYAAGLAVQQDAIRAQIEQTAMRGELIGLESEKRQLTTRLNALLSRDAGAPLAEPRSLRPVPTLATGDAPALAERARSRNPDLRAGLARLEAAQKNRDLAQKNRYPDLLVGVSPSQVGSRITAWGVMFELSIPLQQAVRRGQEREAEAMVGAARSRSEALSNQLLGELAGQLASLDAARRTAVLIRTRLLPQSELSLQSATASYENGKLDFATVLEAQRQIRKARQDLLKAEVEAQLRLADIERIVGEDL